MREVRGAQTQMKAFSGRNYLPPETTRSIAQALNDSSLVNRIKQAMQVDLLVNLLAERFEEMCRRQGVVVDAQLRPCVIKLLALELWINNIVLGRPGPEKLVAVTMREGAIAPELLKEFAEYPRYMVTVAMSGWPSTSRETLRRADKAIKALSEEPEFQGLARSVLEYHAINSPSDIRSRLRKLRDKTSERG